MSNSFYREIINEHNLRPLHKHILPRAGLSHRGVNPSCGDDITLQLTIQDGVISEVCVTNGQVVEYGTELFRIRR